MKKHSTLKILSSLALSLCLIVQTPLSAQASRFIDVDASASYAEAVDYVADNGLMIGVSDYEFAPMQTLNRAMMVTVLYRFAGEPAVAGSLPFQDVAIPSWFGAPVMWAQQNGVVNGYNEAAFGPSDILTREQMVTILWRYAGKPLPSAANPVYSYDLASVSDYAREAVNWAVSTGLISEDSYGFIYPQNGATRGDMAYALREGMMQGYLIKHPKSAMTRFAVIGDSISTFAGMNPEGYWTYYPEGDLDEIAETWWGRLADNKGWELTVNASWSGSFMCGDSEDSSAWVGCTWRRVWDLVRDPDGVRAVPDKIFIMMGANDLFRSRPLGSMEGYSPNNSATFANAYGLLILRLQHTYPASEIICLTSPPAYDEDGGVFTNEGYQTIRDYNDIISAVGAAHGARVIDTFSALQSTGSPRDFLIDGIHPTADGALLIANHIAGQIQ